MADITIRDVSEDLVERLKESAESRGRSIEQEVLEILEAHVPPTHAQRLARREEAVRFMDQMRAELQGKITGDSTDLIREDRDSR